MLNQIYIHYITTLFVLESFISCWLLKGKKIGIGIGIGQFARKKSVSESATKNHDRASLNKTLNTNGRNYGTTDLFLGDITVLLFILLILFLKL